MNWRILPKVYQPNPFQYNLHQKAICLNQNHCHSSYFIPIYYNLQHGLQASTQPPPPHPRPSHDYWLLNYNHEVFLITYTFLQPVQRIWGVLSSRRDITSFRKTSYVGGSVLTVDNGPSHELGPKWECEVTFTLPRVNCQNHRRISVENITAIADC